MIFDERFSGHGSEAGMGEVIQFPEKNKPKSGSHAESIALLAAEGFDSYQAALQGNVSPDRAERLKRILKIYRATAAREGINLDTSQDSQNLDESPEIGIAKAA